MLVAYDAETGEEEWSTDLGGNGGILNMQPSTYDGLVFASTSGYGAGTRATITPSTPRPARSSGTSR